MIIETEALRAAYQVIDKVPSSPLLTSQYIRMTCATQLRMNLTGLVIAEAKVPVQEPAGASWALLADRKIFGGYLAAIHGKQVTFITNDNKTTLKSGRHVLDLVSTAEIRGYQQWVPEKAKQEIKLNEDLLHQLGMLAQYAPDLASTDHLAAVSMLKGYGMVATDSMTLAACLDARTPQTVLLPGSLARLVPALANPVLRVESKGIAIPCAQGYLYQNKLGKDYPQKSVQQLIAQGLKAPEKLRIPVKELAEAAIFLETFASFGEETNSPVLVSVRKKMLVLGMKLKSGTTEKSIALGDGAPQIETQWQLSQMLPWIKHYAQESGNVSYSENDQGQQFFRIGKTGLLAMVKHAS